MDWERFRSLLPAPIRRSYAAKFGIALVVIGLFIGVVGAQTYAQTDAELTQVVEGQLTTAAQFNANKAGQWYTERAGETRTLSTASDVSSNNTVLIDSFLHQQKGALDGVRQIHFVDTSSGEAVVSTDPEADGSVLDAERAPWVENLAFESLESVHVSRPYQLGNETVVAFATPVPRARNRAVVVVAETAGLTGNLTTPVEGGYTRVVDRNGSDVLDSRGEGLHTQYAEGSGDSGPVAAGLAGNVGITDGTAAAGTDGQLVAYAPAGDTSWAVLVHAPRGAAFQLRSTISTNLLLLLAGALGGLTLIGLTLGRGTVRSLRTLTTKAEQLQDGNLEIDVESDRSDEIGQLFAAFGNMRDSLRAQITEAEDAKEQATAAKERAETARTEAEAARQEAEALATDLEQKADEYSAVMARCADGDLTQRLPTDADNEAMCEIARSFNRMLDDLEATVGEVTSFADLVAASSRETEASIEAANAGAGGSADGDGVAVVADEVKALASETKDSAAEIEALVEDVRAETEQAVTAMRETKRLVSRSVDTVGDVKTTREQRARANDLEDLVDQYVVDTDAEATDGNSTDARTGAEN